MFSVSSQAFPVSHRKRRLPPWTSLPFEPISPAPPPQQLRPFLHRLPLPPPTPIFPPRSSCKSYPRLPFIVSKSALKIIAPRFTSEVSSFLAQNKPSHFCSPDVLPELQMLFALLCKEVANLAQVCRSFRLALCGEDASLLWKPALFLLFPQLQLHADQKLQVRFRLRSQVLVLSPSPGAREEVEDLLSRPQALLEHLFPEGLRTGQPRSLVPRRLSFMPISLRSLSLKSLTG